MAKIDDFAETIFRELMDYSEEVDKKMQKQIEKKSKEICNRLKTHPNIPIDTGEYKQGFKIKRAAQGMGYKRNIIYNKKGQITHLLEYGYTQFVGITKGQRQVHTKGGRVKAHPHWEDAQKMADELYDEMIKELQK